MSNYLPTGARPRPDGITLDLMSGELRADKVSLSRHYRAGKEGLMSLCDEEKGLCVIYENDAKYAFRLIYCRHDDGYICLEPQTCLANCQNSPIPRDEAGFGFIKPRASVSYTSRIYLKELIK